MRLLWLADRCRSTGLNVVEVAGWRTRGLEPFEPRGVIAHHTAGSTRGDAPSLGICINGRSGLPGPLCQVFLARSGTVHIVASARANHAGIGTWKGLSGNSSVIGIEAENTGLGEPWSKAQLDAYDRLCAALLAGINRSSDWLCGHREWTTRKIDPHGIDMVQMRRRVTALLDRTPPPAPAQPPTSEEDDMSQADTDHIKGMLGAIAEQNNRTLTALGAHDAQIKELRRNVRKIAAAAGVPADEIE